MFHFYVLSFFKKRDTIQGGTLFKGEHYLRKYGMYILWYKEIRGAMLCLLAVLIYLCGEVVVWLKDPSRYWLNKRFHEFLYFGIRMELQF